MTFPHYISEKQVTGPDYSQRRGLHEEVNNWRGDYGSQFRIFTTDYRNNKHIRF